MERIPAPEVRVGDVIWKEQRHVVTKVQHLSVSTAITARATDVVGVSVQWRLENWQMVEVTRQ